MSIDLDALEAIAKLAESDTRAPLTKISKADMALVHATPATVILEMIALIRRQEKELIGARERRSEPSAVRVTIVDERRQGLDMVDHRLRQILNPPAPFHGEKWAAADALYWLTGDQAFADQADGLAAESLKGEKEVQAELPKTAEWPEYNDDSRIDFSLRKGDIVYDPGWGGGVAPVEVIDVNWATRSIAVRLIPHEGIVVWPAGCLTRVPAEKPKKE